uniref:Ribulose-1,5-bisphosphate carboxylase/oxygenase large subunit n=2 Tax=Bursaphelenchus xylophilus TaxID=6326 RepID=A0A1I7SJI3_BURXY
MGGQTDGGHVITYAMELRFL